MPAPATRPIRVWDLPTRLFHWALAATLVGSVISGQVGGHAMVWHFRLGFLALGLMLFRLAWGLVGGRWSRFASFVYAPATVLRYLRGQPRAGEHWDVGHNPLGAFSVFGLMLLVLVQAGTGLVADDEIANVGPLNRFVAGATAAAATSWHKGPGKTILIVLVLLHVAAVLFYLFRKKNNLVRPMIGGDKELPVGVPPSRDDAGSRILALVLAAASAAAVTWVARLGG